MIELTDIRCHFLSTYFCEISGHDSVIQSIEHTHQPSIHPGRRLSVEDKVESHEGGEHGEVTKDTNDVADLVDEKEPLVHESWCCALSKNQSYYVIYLLVFFVTNKFCFRYPA